jgi:hypothetical protein
MPRSRIPLLAAGIAVSLVSSWTPVFQAGQRDRPVGSPSNWHTYKNTRYSYEIQYPDGFELWATGPEARRDGASIRIAFKEYAAPAPVLDIHVARGMTEAGRLPETGTADLAVTVEDVELNGVRSRQVTYRWKQNGEILFVELHQPNVLFRFEAAAGLEDVRDTIWWQIMSTFRFRTP